MDGRHSLLAPGPVVRALGAHLVLFVLLAFTLGPSLTGWLAAAVYAVTAGTLLLRAFHHSAVPSFGAANQVTLLRTTLVGGVTVLVSESFVRPVPVVALVLISTVALILDAVDGQVARRTGTASPLGARFDMEVDAFLILLLSIFVATSVGWWVLAIGVMRYAFVVASWLFSWLRRPLPPSLARKTVAALQGILLVVASSTIVPLPWTAAFAALALALLTWSFGRDVRWLWRRRSSLR